VKKEAAECRQKGNSEKQKFSGTLYNPFEAKNGHYSEIHTGQIASLQRSFHIIAEQSCIFNFFSKKCERIR